MMDPSLAYYMGTFLVAAAGLSITSLLAASIVILVAIKRNQLYRKIIKELQEGCSILKQENLAMRQQLSLPPERRIMLEVEPEPQVKKKEENKSKAVRHFGHGTLATVQMVMGSMALGYLAHKENSAKRDG